MPDSQERGRGFYGTFGIPFKPNKEYMLFSRIVSTADAILWRPAYMAVDVADMISADMAREYLDDLRNLKDPTLQQVIEELQRYEKQMEGDAAEYVEALRRELEDGRRKLEERAEAEEPVDAPLHMESDL